MGGGSSRYEPPIPPEPTVTKTFKVDGLHTGDVVTVNGEAYAGPTKYFTVEFYNGNDIVFHFKVLPLDNDGKFNKVKLNTMVAYSWGSEEWKDNLIYLNYHFQLKFTCLEDKFSVELNGEHFCDYSHRITPDKIDRIYFNGDANWKDIILPEKAKSDEVLEVDVHIPTQTEVKLFVESLKTDDVHLKSATDSSEDTQRLSNLITEGLKITKKILGDDKPSLMQNIAKFSGYLKSAFSAGSALFGFIQFVATYGEPSQMAVMMQTLNEINEQLKKLQETVEKGFADVVEHMDFVQFREEVTIPVRTMFDLYLRTFTVRGTAPVEDFKKQCKEKKSPRDVFSAMYDFLDSKKNIFETHLKAQKYVYSVYDEWSNALFNYSAKLIVMNMFYYGILVEERKSTGNEDPLINEEDEINDLINQIIRMDARLKEIEENRMKTFHSEGYGADFLREHYKNNVTHSRGDYMKRLPYDILPRIAYQLKNSWKGFNGPTDYQILVIRGTARDDSRLKAVRYAKCHVADKEKVSVAENVGQVTERDEDTITIVLIQSVTKEIREANDTANKNQEEKIKEIISKANSDWDILPANTLGKIKEALPTISCKPLVVLYCTDFGYNETQFDMIFKPFIYEMSSEAWSSPGGPHPLKSFWVSQPDFMPTVRREVQILFQ